ncbi:MAG: hypothetical protein ABUS54_07295 [Actinomycetota bacterium]
MLGALALMTSVASAAPTASPSVNGMNFGFAEDATKYADDGGDKLFTEMNKLSTTTNRVAVFWNADAPTSIQDQSFLDRMIPVAKKHNIQVVFAIYPLKAAMSPTTADAVDKFCNYAVLVMQRYTYVKKVIIGNEPNQPKFWSPVWNGTQPASPAAMEAVMASCYDKLKAFDQSMDVIAVGLSPRGNDHATGDNSSISPVRFIKAFGDAYRASGRTKPVFDEWSWHCYPNINTDEVEKGYDWPNTGCVNAARVKLALYDAFHGTAQPILAGYTNSPTATDLFGSVSKMFIDETGWQVDTTGRPGYTNTENVPPVSEAKQAEDYEKLVHLSNCEPTLTDFHIFHEIDESDRTGFQSGVLRVDFSERPSAADPANSVQHALQKDNGTCSGDPWRTLGSFLYSSSAVVPQYATFPYASAVPFLAKQVSGGGIYVQINAGEGFTWTATFTAGGKTASASGTTDGDTTTDTVKVPTGFGTGSVSVTLKAQTNPSRTSTATLQLGSGGGTTGGATTGGGSKQPPLCKKHQKPTKKHPCRKQ